MENLSVIDKKVLNNQKDYLNVVIENMTASITMSFW